jgi:hypothetical protein
MPEVLVTKPVPKEGEEEENHSPENKQLFVPKIMTLLPVKTRARGQF